MLNLLKQGYSVQSIAEAMKTKSEEQILQRCFNVCIMHKAKYLECAKFPVDEATCQIVENSDILVQYRQLKLKQKAELKRQRL